jgi:methionyl aminopeptidase
MLRGKTEEEINLIRESSLLVGKTLAEVAALVKPGVTPRELDKRAFEFISDHGAVPGFLNYNGFPNSLCISKNEAVVHGIPDGTPLKDGDIVSVDCGVLKNGYYGDSAYTFAVGEVSDEVSLLLETTKRSLMKGIEQAIAGNRVGDIGFAVQQEAESKGFGVVRELVGHGIGKKLHEAPEVPNFGRRGGGTKLIEGLVIAIEPMINLGTKEVNQLRDGWTIVTADRKPSAHFEHTIVVRKGKAEVLSTFEFVEEKLNVIV